MGHIIPMKLYLIAAMVLAGLCSYSEAAPKKKSHGNLGNVLYIGDSITHGFKAPSYRWALHKIFVDNGIDYEEIGIETGSHSGGVESGAIYIARPFKNLHAAMSGQRAYETSGRDHEGSNRLDATDIYDWFNIEGKSDSDKRRINEKPDTCFILLGTNDLLSDNDNVAKVVSGVQKNMLDKKRGDMSLIVEAIRQVNPKAQVYVLAVPAWGKTAKNNTAKDYEAVIKKFNSALMKRFKKEFVDINQGLVDIANVETPGKVVDGFVNAGDQLHPTPHGDMIMAGLVARAMGIAGRTAGMDRKAATALAHQPVALVGSASEKSDVEVDEKGIVTVKAGGKMVAPWGSDDEAKQGFTVDFQMSVGDGARGGWKKDPMFTVTVGNGVHSGHVSVSECYIIWNDKQVLYPINMAKNRENVRVAWIPGSASQGVNKGFYVWLGDMLIGEGLPDDNTKLNGVSLANVSDSDVVLKSLSTDGKPLAPATKNYVKKAPDIVYDEEQIAPVENKPDDAKK